MTAFCGWLRLPGRAWRVACRASSYRACWMLLIGVKPPASSCEKFVNTGAHPDARRKPR